MTLHRGRRPDGEAHLHPGYSYVDHQLNPLMEVIREWAFPSYGPERTEEEQERDRVLALEAIGAVEHAMKHVRWQVNNPGEW